MDNAPPSPPARAWSGRLITFEGGEGTGKSTQVQRLQARLQALGHPVLCTREPGGTPHAELLRRIILSGALSSLGPASEAIAFAAARIDHIDKVIRPALAGGTFVLCDRFMDSTRAYQGLSGAVSPSFIKALEAVSIGAVRPDLTLVFDAPAEMGMKRAALRRTGAPDRFERESLTFHRALRQKFLDIANQEPDRCVIIDARGSIDDSDRQIWQAVTQRLLLVSLPETNGHGL
jgi:dTMP kinase